ncbi:unnamed protein product [Adineta ricciae]|uniref:Uncharacterized protein n=1 Tax=Adineta ricciae TaxID=249248 RepID=A0A813RL78_ADIRI|nr:unnamed protein product [Adineta ricciae]CAF0846664.1 unnamed protein product [Adineta ricciae]
MSRLLIWICLIVASLNLSLATRKRNTLPHRAADDQNNEENGYLAIPDGTYVSSTCLIQAASTKNSQKKFKTVSSPRKSRGKHNFQRDDSREQDSSESSSHSASSDTIRLVFTIPYAVENGSIVNRTLVITDAHDDQITPLFSYVCVNGSSFLVHYITEKALPHYVCLNLLLNLTSSRQLKEIYMCQTVSKNVSSHDDHDSDKGHGDIPSFIFIVSQGVIILVMMLIISLVHSVRRRNLANCVGQHLRNLPLAQAIRNSMLRDESPPALRSHRSASIGRQVLAATDLTATGNDRPSTDYALINIKELTKQMSR